MVYLVICQAYLISLGSAILLVNYIGLVVERDVEVRPEWSDADTEPRLGFPIRRTVGFRSPSQARAAPRARAKCARWMRRREFGVRSSPSPARVSRQGSLNQHPMIT